MAARRDRYRQPTTKPTLGGMLITRGSADNAGYLNYTTKRDWRRSLDVEVRREGCDYFGPNLDLSQALQAFPGKIQLNTLTFSGGVVTATRLQGQWFEDGETIIITGASDSKYNGTFPIFNVTETTFQYTITDTPVSPDTSEAIFATPVEELNLLALARRPNGQTAVIAGSHRRLYRYFALEDSDYISRDPADYPPGTPADELSYWSDGTLFPADAADYPPGTPTLQQQYVDTTEIGYWVVIGSGFSPAGKRWETVNINGYMVFNNSVDLLVTYRVEELEVVPIYEMREQGIFSVGTISEINGILMCADLTELRVDKVADWFNTSSDPYGPYTGDPNDLDRTTFRVGWATPDEPRRWNLIVPGSMALGSNVITTEYPVLGFNVGQSITITGAGTPHAGGTADNLTANIINITGATIIVDKFAATAVTDAIIEATDAEGSIVGFEDLQDDGSGIVKMLPLADQLVIYKDTSVFLCQYLGIVDQPFGFTIRRIQKEQSCYYRNTLALVQTPEETFHVYAGRNDFYRFDLSTQQPKLLPKFEACSDVFFDNATLSRTEEIYAADNGVTHEIWWMFPSNGADKGLAYDTKRDSLAQLGFACTAAATIRKPIVGLASGAEQDWFIMGTDRGTVVVYGLTNEPQGLPDWNNKEAIWFRRFANPYSSTKTGYESLLVSGLASFGDDYREKDMRALVPLWSSHSPNTAITVTIGHAHNANAAVQTIGTRTVSDPLTAIELGFRANYFQAEFSVNGMDNDCQITGYVWDISLVDSRSATRAS